MRIQHTEQSLFIKSAQNLSDSKLYRNTNSKQFREDLPHDIFTFSGKIPKVKHQKLRKITLKNYTISNFVNLANFYDISCPCCGDNLFGIKKFLQFEHNIRKCESTSDYINLIDKDKKYLHAVEKNIFDVICEQNKLNPGLSCLEILKIYLLPCEMLLVERQKSIFRDLKRLSKQLSPNRRKSLVKLIDTTNEKLDKPSKTSNFSRKAFLDKLDTIINRLDNKKLATQIIYTASQLPTASNSFEAFIVKYSKRNYKDADPNKAIVKRLLSGSVATAEHIKPKYYLGDDSPGNIALECARDNNARKHKALSIQVYEHPEMKWNYSKYMEGLVNIERDGLLDKEIIFEQNKTFTHNSAGLLSASLKFLKHKK